MGGKVGRRTLAATEHFCSDDGNKKTVVLYFGKVSRYTNGGCSCLLVCGSLLVTIITIQKDVRSVCGNS